MATKTKRPDPAKVRDAREAVQRALVLVEGLSWSNQELDVSYAALEVADNMLMVTQYPEDSTGTVLMCVDPSAQITTYVLNNLSGADVMEGANAVENLKALATMFKATNNFDKRMQGMLSALKTFWKEMEDDE